MRIVRGEEFPWRKYLSGRDYSGWELSGVVIVVGLNLFGDGQCPYPAFAGSGRVLDRLGSVQNYLGEEASGYSAFLIQHLYLYYISTLYRKE